MRTPQYDLVTDTDRAKGRGKAQPERRCVVTGEVAPAERLVRLALGPDGVIAADVHAKAPGRGAWISVNGADLETARAKGKLKGGIIRALQESQIIVPDDIVARIEAQLQRATLERLGLESRAGNLITGNDRIEEAARRGNVKMLLHAADAGDDGRRKLAQAWRVGSGAEGTDLAGQPLPVDRGALSMALGRENAVHIAVTNARAADRVSAHLNRWQFFTGWSRDMDSRGPNADSHQAGSESREAEAGAASEHTDTAVSDAY